MAKTKNSFSFQHCKVNSPLTISTSVTPFSDSEKFGSSYPKFFYFLNPRIDINWFQNY